MATVEYCAQHAHSYSSLDEKGCKYCDMARPTDAPSRVFDDREPLSTKGLDKVAACDAPAPYDAVKNPEWYAQYVIQPIEFIVKNNLDYCTGNVIKYVCRHELKDGLQDLKKAREYIDIMIKAEEDK